MRKAGSWKTSLIDGKGLVANLTAPVTFPTGYFGIDFNWPDDQLNSMSRILFRGRTIPLAVAISSNITLIRKGVTFTGLVSTIAARRAAKTKAKASHKQDRGTRLGRSGARCTAMCKYQHWSGLIR